MNKQATSTDSGFIQFPSITVCKQRVYVAHVSSLLDHSKQENTSSEDIKTWVYQNTWRRDKLLQLVGHGSEGRPCITNSNPEEGKICIFPFVYPDCGLIPPGKVCFSGGNKTPSVHRKCIYDESFSWCSTRTHWNNSHITGHFGKCSSHCVENVNHTENLASREFESLWAEGFYRIFNDVIGHCHTYNPENRSSAEIDQKFVAFLGLMKLYILKGHH